MLGNPLRGTDPLGLFDPFDPAEALLGEIGEATHEFGVAILGYGVAGVGVVAAGIGLGYAIDSLCPTTHRAG